MVGSPEPEMSEMNRTVVGDGEFRFAVDPSWPTLPPGVDLGDISDVAIGPDDDVIVLSREPANPIVVFDSHGTLQRSLGEGLFGRVHGVTSAPGGGYIVADDAAHCVHRLDASGHVMSVLGTSGEASDTGTEPGKYMSVKRSGGPFNLPTASVCAPDGSLYVTDGYGNARVHHFAHDGTLQHSFGEPGIGPGEFRLPHAIELTPSGDRLVVADRENSRLQFFDLDGAHIETWTGVSRPNGVAYDPDGNLYVVELGLHTANFPCCDGFPSPPVTASSPPSRVSIWSPTGTLLARWGDGSIPCRAGSFYCAHGIAVDAQGSVYVAQPSRGPSVMVGMDPPVTCHRLQKFSRL